MLCDDEKAAFLTSVERVRQRVASQLGDRKNPSAIVDFVENLHRAVDKTTHQAACQGINIACRIACSHCCSVRVEASEPEIFRIAREVRKRPTVQLETLIEQLRVRVAAAKIDDAPFRRTDCPFLENQRCTIYEVRPATCRKAHSLSAAPCAAFAMEIPQDLNLLLGADALIKGTSDAYRQLGYSCSAHELCNALLLALSDESAEARWLSGEPVF